jgi:peptidyl-prolyl cis-trans isomerase B (cyclophilin B)
MKSLLIPGVVLCLLGCGGHKAKPAAPNPHMFISITGFGPIEIELLPRDAPMNVANLIKLIKSNYYDGLTVHRVIKGFLIQTGCKKGDGSGFPGYHVNDEISRTLLLRKGTVAMANKGPDTNGSQFFICLRETPELEYQYTIVGKVVKGLDIAQKVSEVEADWLETPRKKVVIEKIWVE